MSSYGGDGGLRRNAAGAGGLQGRTGRLAIVGRRSAGSARRQRQHRRELLRQVANRSRLRCEARIRPAAAATLATGGAGGTGSNATANSETGLVAPKLLLGAASAAHRRSTSGYYSNELGSGWAAAPGRHRQQRSVPVPTAATASTDDGGGTAGGRRAA